MPEYTDFQLDLGEYGKAAEYYDENALVLAIRNILLSKPGNFPFTPSMGMNIKKYQFEFLDDQTLSEIQSELSRQLATYLPSLGNITIQIRKVEDHNKVPYLGISVGGTVGNETITSNFLLGKEGDVVNVFNEIR